MMIESGWYLVTNPIVFGKLHPYPSSNKLSAEKVAEIENYHHQNIHDGLISRVGPLYLDE